MTQKEAMTGKFTPILVVKKPRVVGPVKPVDTSEDGGNE